MKIRRAAKFVGMLSSLLKKEEKSIDLLFRGEDGLNYGVELASDVIAPMLVTIAGLSNELRASLPHPDALPTQALLVKDFRVAMNSAGHLGWQLVLESGVSVVLEFDRSQFQALDSRIEEFRRLLDRSVH